MKLLLTGAFKYTKPQIEYIKSLGHQILFIQDEHEKISFDVSDIEGVICNGLFLSNQIENFKSLKYIQLTSAGMDRVPLDYINSHNIELHNARGVYSIPMAELTVLGILQLIKQSYFFYENKKSARWEKSRTLGELAGKRTLILGAGSVGTQIAKRLNAFDVEVIGADMQASDKKYFSCVKPVSNIDELLSIADIVVLTLPLTEETKGFFDESKFVLMKDNAIFVNVSRGCLVNERDMISALVNKKIGGAVLDVFEEEPLDGNSPLWTMENVVLTPHNSFVGENNSYRMFDVIVKNLENFNE